jgi:hypothetical protein
MINMAKIMPITFADPGFHWTAGMLHWDSQGPDADQTWHVFGYSEGPDEIPLGGFDAEQEFATAALAEDLARLWAEMPLVVAVTCLWCRCWAYGPLLWRPNEYRGENRGPRCSTYTKSFPAWPRSIYAGHIVGWPDIP